MSQTEAPIKLVSVAEIARRLGVTRQAVHEQSRRPGFPEPFAVVAKREMPLWLDETIEEWLGPRQWKSTNGGP
jgi:hypothetical protein